MAECRAIRIPGPQGPAGGAGTNGIDGYNAFSLVAEQFDVPAQQTTVDVVLIDPNGNAWMVPGAVVAIQGAGTGATKAGYYEVVSLTGTNQARLLNLRDDATDQYLSNLDGTGSIAVGMKISPGGIQGAAGQGAAGYLEAANNLSDVPIPADARTNLGLGSLAILNTINNGNWSGTDLAVVNGGTGASDAATARTNLGVPASGLATASGLTVSATDQVLGRSSPGAGPVEEFPITAFARTLIDDANAAAARETLGKVGLRYGLLGSVVSVDANANADSVVSIVSSRYRIDKITVENASISLTTATGGVFTAAGGGGTPLAADQALSALTASTKFDDLTLEAVVGTDLRTETTLYFRIGTPQGAAATLNAWIWGWRMD